MLKEISIEKIVNGGEGMGHIDGFPVFVPMSVPGDELEIQLISKKKSYGRGIIKRIIKPGEERIDFPKFTEEDFHGCNFAMLSYEAQLKYKMLLVSDVMKKIGGVSDAYILPIIGSDKEINYRNKVIEPFAYGQNGEIITGMFKRRSHEIFQIDKNMLSSDLSNEVINKVKKILNKNKNISVYNEKSHKGILRHIMTRTNSQNEAMLVLIINAKKIPDEVFALLKEVYEEMDQVKSVYISLNDKRTNVALGNSQKHLFGQRTLQENIKGIDFSISPTSFFQINLEQTKKLYEVGISYFNNIQDKCIVDAFAGIGTIGMILSKEAKQVYSMEIVEKTVADGLRTAKRNNITNVEFICGDVNKKIQELMKDEKTIDAVIFDPPRKGIEEETLRTLSSHKIEELVYISCNPSTFARDSKILIEEGYVLEKIQPLDLFPQTSHIELVGKFTLNKSEVTE